MKIKLYNSFVDDFKAMIKETPGLEDILTAYEKGLLTYTEALHMIVDKYIEYSLHD